MGEVEGALTGHPRPVLVAARPCPGTADAACLCSAIAQAGALNATQGRLTLGARLGTAWLLWGCQHCLALGMGCVGAAGAVLVALVVLGAPQRGKESSKWSRGGGEGRTLDLKFSEREDWTPKVNMRGLGLPKNQSRVKGIEDWGDDGKGKERCQKTGLRSPDSKIGQNKLSNRI